MPFIVRSALSENEINAARRLSSMRWLVVSKLRVGKLVERSHERPCRTSTVESSIGDSNASPHKLH